MRRRAGSRARSIIYTRRVALPDRMDPITRMGHESYERTDAPAGGSDRAFGLVFAAFFLIVAVYPWIFGGGVRVWSLAVAALFLALGLVLPRALSPLNRLWTRFGALLHRVVSPLVLGIMFFGVVTPMGFVRRLLVKDPLHLRFEQEAASYWVPREPPGPPPQSLTNQF